MENRFMISGFTTALIHIALGKKFKIDNEKMIRFSLNLRTLTIYKSYIPTNKI